MLKRAVQLTIVIIGGAIGILFVPSLFELFEFTSRPIINNPYIAAAVGAIVFFFIGLLIVQPIVQSVEWLEEILLKAPILDLIFGTLGLIVGLSVAFLVSYGLSSIELPPLTSVVPIMLSVLLGYLGFQVGFQKREEFMNALFSAKAAGAKKENVQMTDASYKILDTSVIIDGRIADIAKTGFLEGILLVPQFVLTELQHIADSSDSLKRTKGRRGLDVLKMLQSGDEVEVEITNADFDDIHEVDLKLVRLAKEVGGYVVTNDFNLNKVADLHGVHVLNINDLSNAVKPVVIAGERMNVFILKEGKEQGQGVAYLDDGTMIVVENGRNHMNESIDTVVTSVLQTSAGRMIFAKPVVGGES